MNLRVTTVSESESDIAILKGSEMCYLRAVALASGGLPVRVSVSGVAFVCGWCDDVVIALSVTRATRWIP